MEFDLRFTAAAVIATYAVFAALERSRSLRLRESRFLRPFFATDVGWYVVTVGVTLAFGPALQGLAQARGCCQLSCVKYPATGLSLRKPEFRNGAFLQDTSIFIATKARIR